MNTVHNNLNQPLAIGEDVLAAGGSLKVKAVTPEIERLAAKGHVSIAEPAEPQKEDGDNKNKGEKK